MTSFPMPGSDQLSHTARLTQLLREEIAAHEGWIGFSRFMELALYAPGLGYYSGGATKFGADGDFVTAPEISPLFGRTLARQVAQILSVDGGEVLELGAGTGQLAVQLLTELARLDQLPERYLILEVSAHLRQVQQETLANRLPAELLQRVDWLDTLPDSIQGVMVANEVLDALPVHLVYWAGSGIQERGVVWQDDGFAWLDRPLSESGLLARAKALACVPGYLSELCPAATALVASLAERLEQGVMLWVDYGFPRREYYHPQRTTGTLMCHYRQQAHGDPFLYPGLQDITAHVDFTAIAEAGIAAGMTLAGYATQAQFLVNCGLTDLLAEVSPGDVAAYLPLASQAQKLISPAEMGELFKVMAFSKNLSQPLLGFVQGDKRHML